MNGSSNIIREVYDYKELLWALTYRDIRVKYKQAVFGVLWAFFMPMMGILAGVVVQVGLAFMKGTSLQMENVVSVMVRMVPYSLFIGVLSSSASGILGGMGLASKIYFPRQLIPLSTTLSVLVDFAISLVVVVLLVAFLPGSPLVLSWWLLLVAPLLGLLLAMGLGLGLIFGSANLFLRDVKYIMAVLIQFGIFFTPVLYFVDQLGPSGRIMLWNPVAPVLEAISDIVTRGEVRDLLWPYLGYSTLVAALLLVIGTLIFRKTEHLFAEVM
ncbi:MAG: ABC transporter permease [Phycisphaeraceae bacterium]